MRVTATLKSEPSGDKHAQANLALTLKKNSFRFYENTA
jgi:hypothetical protein